MERILLDVGVVGGFCLAFILLTIRKQDMFEAIAWVAGLLALVETFCVKNVLERIALIDNLNGFLKWHGLLVGIVFFVLLMKKMKGAADGLDVDTFVILLLFEMINIVVFTGQINALFFIVFFGAISQGWNKVYATRYLALKHKR